MLSLRAQPLQPWRALACRTGRSAKVVMADEIRRDIKKPKFIRELRRVREKLNRPWRQMTEAQLLKELNSYKLHRPK